jgi:MFS transporter, MHS family, proline/betaine transporter
MVSPGKSSLDTGTPGRPSRRIIVGVCFGHMVEWFEFGAYGYLATVLGKLFFPSTDPTVSVLSALAVFGVAFVARPFGAVMFGHLGDKLGRRTVLAATILLMGGATALIGLLPTYATIGVAAPVLLIACRLLQGLSAGGETSGAAAFLAESAPAGKRALWTSSIQAIGIVAFVFASLLVAVLNATLGEETMAAWGWRVPFLLAFPLAITGLYLRFRVEESPAFQAALAKEQNIKQRAPIAELLREYRKPLLFLIAIVAVEAVASYVSKTYLPTYLIATIGLGATPALLTTAGTLLLAAALVPCFAQLSDRIGRKPLLFWGTVALAIVAVPAFMLVSTGSIAGVVAGQVLAIIPGTAISVSVVVTQAELFPTRVRYSGAAVGYNTAYALFGGTAPFVAAALISAFGTKLMPGWYLVAFALLGLLVITRLPETYRRDMIDAGRPGAPSENGLATT